MSGKRGKTADIPLSSDALEELRQYHQALGMESWPQPGEVSPLLLEIYGRRPVTIHGLHQLLKAVLNLVAYQVKIAGDVQIAATLRKAFAH